MADSLRWTREGGRLSLQGELDQDFLVPLWEAREEATQGIDTIDLTAITRVDTAGVALLMHLVAHIRQQGGTVKIEGKSEKMNTLVQLYNLTPDLIP
ncbi:lipid asymmetry maintenance protein MlaB [Scandinavium sp. V105_16]|uniref:Lipid asymmetry maintenance protein MlaB n=1 Tax=Scandinavium lactucae TaxID=3095028 RepID=A0AAJ2S2L5_9ENTR|nr:MULTISPECIES: lipid asymmetry maintenance protein MlaB [unclassified Scandinavium]MDX6020584.1 lipid asymmetry maintenance protein MlaB [Scandinavium sp. V105_16]MDX6030804.1 lipid asymmetry maintenance protein MlaB [Scandinavium sp. V105_12]MDX6040859.1 lipid asymmetry maintenance protein MlaB [Scandinavium sp. V105_6]MDX6051763.1 lipid asymmetry maintenance protein MlaB [Scandinavium sp. V105_1]